MLCGEDGRDGAILSEGEFRDEGRGPWAQLPMADHALEQEWEPLEKRQPLIEQLHVTADMKQRTDGAEAFPCQRGRPFCWNQREPPRVRTAPRPPEK